MRTLRLQRHTATLFVRNLSAIHGDAADISSATADDPAARGIVPPIMSYGGEGSGSMRGEHKESEEACVFENDLERARARRDRRYARTKETEVIMQCKLVICKMLKHVCDMRQDRQVTAALTLFRNNAHKFLTVPVLKHSAAKRRNSVIQTFTRQTS